MNYNDCICQMLNNSETTAPMYMAGKMEIAFRGIQKLSPQWEARVSYVPIELPYILCTDQFWLFQMIPTDEMNCCCSVIKENF
jgi:hypothetical protein